MIKIGDKEYRNLQEQVEKNMKDIKQLMTGVVVLDEFGIKVVGNVESIDDLPSVEDYKEAHEDWAYGDAYAIGTEAPYELYILTRADEQEHPTDYWFYIGEFPMPGPQGEQGIQGETGATGPQGEQGIQGIQGVQGNRGTSIYALSKNLSNTIGSYNETNKDGIDYMVGDVIIGQNGYIGKITSVGGATVIYQVMASIVGPQGAQGSQGAQGQQGVKGDAGLSIFYCSSNISATVGSTVLTPKEDIITQTSSITPVINDLVVGANGYLGYVIGIGTNTYQIKTLIKLKGENGTNGTNGTNGQDGVSPSVSVSSITGGHEVSITDAQGTQTFDIMDGIDGQDGQDGVSPVVSAAATVDSQVGTPSVTVVKSGTDAAPVFTFEFHNLKGETGTSLISVEVVNSLPASGNAGTLYFVPNGSASGTDLYNEYIWVNNAWELLGTAAVDLSNYIQKSQTAGLIKNDGTVDTTQYLSSIPNTYIQKSETAGLIKNDGTIDTNTYALASQLLAADGKTIINDNGELKTQIGGYNEITTYDDVQLFGQSNNAEFITTADTICAYVYEHIEADTTYNDCSVEALWTLQTNYEITSVVLETSTKGTWYHGVLTINYLVNPSQPSYWEWELEGSASMMILRPRTKTSGSLSDPALEHNILVSIPGVTPPSTQITKVPIDEDYLPASVVKKSNTTGLIKNDGTIDTNTYALASALANYVLSSSLAAVATSGNYNDLVNTPTIPTVDYPVTDVQVDGVSVVSNKVASITTPTSVPEVNYLTTAPSADNTSGNLKFVVLSAEPATYYNGYIYYITEA